MREIAAAIGPGSPSSVTHHLKALDRLGLLRRDARAPRAVDVRQPSGSRAAPYVAKGAGIVRVPLIGTVAAGIPILAENTLRKILSCPQPW